MQLGHLVGVATCLGGQASLDDGTHPAVKSVKLCMIVQGPNVQYKAVK